MASETDETHHYCSSDENNGDQLGKDRPSVVSPSIQQLAMTLFPWKQNYVKEETGWVLWVGSYQARSCSVQTRSVLTVRSPRLNIPLSSQLSIAHSLKNLSSKHFCLSLFMVQVSFSVFGSCSLLILINKAYFFSPLLNTIIILSFSISLSVKYSEVTPTSPTCTLHFPLNPHKYAHFNNTGVFIFSVPHFSPHVSIGQGSRYHGDAFPVPTDHCHLNI